jgi:hypothetical protein
MYTYNVLFGNLALCNKEEERINFNTTVARIAIRVNAVFFVLALFFGGPKFLSYLPYFVASIAYSCYARFLILCRKLNLLDVCTFLLALYLIFVGLDFYYSHVDSYNLFLANITLAKICNKNSLFSSDSYIFNKAKEIINGEGNSVSKQSKLEKLFISYEKEFILNLISNLNTDNINYNLVYKIYSHSSPNLINKIDRFISNEKIKNYKNYFEVKENLNNHEYILLLGLFLLIDSNELSNIMFAKVIRLIGVNGYIKRSDIITGLSSELLIKIKYNLMYKEN